MEEAIRHVRGSNATDAVLLLAYVTRSMCCRWGSILVFKAFCRSSGRIFVCFAFRLGSTAFTASLYFQLTCVLLSLIRRALHCGKVVFSFLIAKFVRKAAGCGFYRIAVRILRFGQIWFASLVLLTSALKTIEPHPPVRAWYRERRSPSHLP